MRRERTVAARAQLLDRLPVTGDILRGSLLQRTIRNHARSCAKCASGEGHQLAVLTVSYAGGKTRQLSLRREQVGEVRRWLANYRKLKVALEAIWELNHRLFRPAHAAVSSARCAAGSLIIGISRSLSKRFANSITTCCVRTTPRHRAAGAGGRA